MKLYEIIFLQINLYIINFNLYKTSFHIFFFQILIEEIYPHIS